MVASGILNFGAAPVVEGRGSDILGVSGEAGAETWRGAGAVTNDWDWMGSGLVSVSGAGAWTGESGMMSFGAAAAAGSSIFGGAIEACAGASVGLRSLGRSGAGVMGSTGVGMAWALTVWASE